MRIELHFGEALFCCNREKSSVYFADFILFFIILLLYNKATKQEVNTVTVRERILALKLLSLQEQQPEYTQRIGIQVVMTNKDPEDLEENDV
jgi:hypothetical protein